ncbi:MAG TPA: DNA polymerase I, partial [Candidatus Eremiobacteraceae bacterium]|nr:DNA polymerase I [Candidatus Eremiobacteraceae bacterium]
SIAKRELPIDIVWDELKYEPPPRERLAKFYDAFEFRTLSSRASNGDGKASAGGDITTPSVAPLGEEIPTRYRTLEESPAAEAIGELRARPAVGVALIGGNDGNAVGVAFSGSPGDAFVVPERSVMRHTATVSALDALLNATAPRIAVHDSKSVFAWANANDRSISNVGFDTMLAAGLVDPTLGEPSLAEAARMSGAVVTLVEKPKAPAAMDLFATPAALDSAFAAHADAVLRSTPVLERMLEDAGQTSLLRDIELPLARILAKMEACGFALDVAELDRIRAELDGMIARASADIFETAGEEFNLNSPKAVGAILFEKMSLPGGIKKKTGYATGIEVLGPLSAEHPIAAKILEYREVAKLKSTYVDALPALVNPKTGAVHTTFHQLGAATGRLSSTNPNLQNIPVRTAAGKAIRRAFVPRRADMALVAADYSQIELRLFAHFSQDENLIAAFASGHDAHAYTARRVFGVPDDQPLDPELRRRAKAINFGVLYGMGSFGLAQSAGITRAEAREFIAQYFARFPRIKGYIDAGLAKARSDGFVTTILGRRRYLPDLRSSNHALRAAAERMAINAPLQGSAADLVKLAMVRVASGIEEKQIDANMLLQVHDELIFEVPTKDISRLRAVVEDAMENAMALRVPLGVHFSSGPTWADLE